MSVVPPVLFVGLGRIGTPIARRLIEAGVELHLYDEDRSALADFAIPGATILEPGALATLTFERVVLCLPDPDAVRGLIGAWLAHPIPAGAIVADLTTVAPGTARDLAARLAAAGGSYLEAPVSGGQRGAEDGRMVVLSSGDPAAFEAVRELLGHIGETVHYLGSSGQGSLLKAVNQYVYLSYNFAFAQGLRLARELDLPEAAVLDTFTKGAAAHPLINDRLGPSRSSGWRRGFVMRRCLKDLDCLELEAGFESDSLELYALLRRRLAEAVAEGMGELDILALAEKERVAS